MTNPPTTNPPTTNPLLALSLDELRRRTSVRWREYPPDVLPAWVAEMDVPLAEPVARAVRDAIALGDTGYPHGTGYLRALAEFAAARWGWAPEVEQMVLVPDVMNGIVEVLRLVTREGDTVVVNPPVYPPFYQFVARAGRTVAEAPLTAAYRLDLAALEAAFATATATGRGAAYLLCSPHNPTGTVHTREELAAVTFLAGRYGVRVVVDEIHAPLVLAGATHVPYLTVPGSDDAFALLSASKAWNLAGLKAAVAVAGRAAVPDLARLPDEVYKSGPSHLGVIAHTAALREGVGWLDSLLTGLAGNRDLLGRLLAEHLPGIGYREPAATYLAWLDCRPLALGADPAAAFLARGRVALAGGDAFGTGGAGHVRLTFATPPDLLAEAVRRMASAVRPAHPLRPARATGGA
jgi:cysteine-S-conjugate beta-lyase